VLRQSEVLAELDARGVTSINRIPKKADKDLVDEARALATEVPVLIEKLRKSGLGSPSRILKKAEYELIAPKPEPVMGLLLHQRLIQRPVAIVTKIDGEEVELKRLNLKM
jgi:RNA polymerase primary sigma factor